MSAVIERVLPAQQIGPVILGAGNFEVRLARHADEVAAAQRLRYQVFAEEMGARLPNADGGLDVDMFDRFCEHLLVHDRERDEVVGTYRIMFPEQARQIGCLYADQEFWLTRLDPIRGDIVELGRSCVHPDYRSGGVIMLLWAGLGELLARRSERFVIGCVSVPMADGGHYAASLYRKLAARHQADESLRVWPKDRLPIESLYHDCDVVIAPLIKGYLRVGAQLLGEPHRDFEFGCADLPMLLPIERINPRYARRFSVG